MNLHLRVLHGTLKRQDGASIGSDIAVHGKQFVVGSGPECNMRCPSSTISEHHCEIVSEPDGIFVRDLKSETGTFVNGERVTEKQQLANGDHLKIGKLEFEVVITAPKKPAEQPRTAEPPKKSPLPHDSMGDNISDLLTAADEEERAKHHQDPTARQFKPAPEVKPAAAEEKKEEKKKLVRPPQKPPGKLPPPPKVVADNTVNAAEEVLKKLLDKQHKK